MLIEDRTSIDTPTTLPPASLLSDTGRITLRAAADNAATTTRDPAAARLLQRAAHHGDELRAVLDQLAHDLASGDVTAAQTRLQAVLGPAQQIDAAQRRFREAQAIGQSALAAVQAAAVDPDQHIPSGRLRDLHTTASAVAAASAAAAAAGSSVACVLPLDPGVAGAFVLTSAPASAGTWRAE